MKRLRKMCQLFGKYSNLCSFSIFLSSFLQILGFAWYGTYIWYSSTSSSFAFCSLSCQCIFPLFPLLFNFSTEVEEVQFVSIVFISHPFYSKVTLSFLKNFISCVSIRHGLFFCCYPLVATITYWWYRNCLIKVGFPSEFYFCDFYLLFHNLEKTISLEFYLK